MPATLQPIIEEYLEKGRQTMTRRCDNGAIAVAYTCSFIPPEIIEAAGGVSFRLIRYNGSGIEASGSRYLRSDACSFCRMCLGDFPPEGFPEPDIIIGASPCDQMRRTMELFKRTHGVKVILLHVPRTVGKSSTVNFYRDELERLGNAIARQTGVPDWQKRLPPLVQRRRDLYKRLSDLDSARQDDPPGLTGLEALMLSNAAWEMPVDVFQEMVEAVERALNERQSPYSQGVMRLLLMGSCYPAGDYDIVNYIENSGAAIVTDTLCSGIRHLHYNCRDDQDPLMGLAECHLQNGSCPALKPNDRMYSELVRLSTLHNIDAAILLTLKFCHPWEFEIVRLRHTLDVPIMEVDRDLSMSSEGQWKTRIGAFLETLSLKRNAAVI